MKNISRFILIFIIVNIIQACITKLMWYYWYPSELLPMLVRFAFSVIMTIYAMTRLKLIE